MRIVITTASRATATWSATNEVGSGALSSLPELLAASGGFRERCDESYVSLAHYMNVEGLPQGGRRSV